MAKFENPTYTAYILDDAGTKYDLTQVLVSIDLSDQDSQMAQKAVVTIHNVMIGEVWSTSVIQVRQRIFIFADDGERQDEVFRGFIWRKDYVSSNSERDFSFTCYDNMIYFQESEDYDYFSAGKSTEDVIGAFCERWGIELEYNYESITHEKLMLKGTLSNIFQNDILDLVQDRTGVKYVMRSEKDKLRILTVGINEEIYQLLAYQNVVQTKSTQTMEGVITKVVFQGKEGTDTRPAVEAEVSENTDKFGTLQKVVNRNESASLEDAKKEAQAMLDMFKNPFWEYEVEAPDIPWIRKGDKVYINAGDIYQLYLIVKTVQRTIDMKGGSLMHLTLDDGLPKTFTPTTFSGSSSSVGAEEETEEEKQQNAATSGNTGTINDGTVSSSQQAVINSAYSTPSAGYNLCATWVTWVFSNVGIHFGGNGCDMTANYCYSTNRNDLKPGMIIGCVHSPWSYTYGHIAVYVGNNTVLSCELGTVATYSVDGFIATYGPSNGGSTVMWGWGGGVPLA